MHVLMAAVASPYHQEYMQHFHSMEDNRLIWLFVWAIIIDILTGLARSLVSHHTTSSKGINGMIKHGVVLLIILTLYPMLDANGMKSAADAMTTFYILFYTFSIMENLGQMGLPLPDWVSKYIYKLSDEYKEDHHESTKRHY